MHVQSNDEWSFQAVVGLSVLCWCCFFFTLHFSFECFYSNEPIKIDLFPTNEHAAAHECQIRFIVRVFFFSVQSTPQTRRFKFDVMIELFETKAKINWISSRSFKFNVWLNHRKWMKKKRNEHILGVEWSWDGEKNMPSHIRSIMISGWLCVRKLSMSILMSVTLIPGDRYWLDDPKTKLKKITHTHTK